jgi:transcriptional regulator with XRE-family HTH domain
MTVGARLRDVRTQKGLSLQQVEAQSGGRWKTAAVGSYERADRMISVGQLAALASFYDVPLDALLADEGSAAPHTRAARVVLNLPALAQPPVNESARLRRWVEQIRRERDDWAGQVLSIRAEDLRALATMYDLSLNQLVERLRLWKVLDATSDVDEIPDGA